MLRRGWSSFSEPFPGSKTGSGGGKRLPLIYSVDLRPSDREPLGPMLPVMEWNSEALSYYLWIDGFALRLTTVTRSSSR